jgi:hypothetical protein
MAKLQRDLSEFIGLLNSRGVEYLVVGGHAVAFHGHPRLTGDIDLLLRPIREACPSTMHGQRESLASSAIIRSASWAGTP